MESKKYFLSFIREFWDNPLLDNWIMGRVEVYSETSEYAIEEIPFAFNYADEKRNMEWGRFEDTYDFAEVDKGELDSIRMVIQGKFYDNED